MLRHSSLKNCQILKGKCYLSRWCASTLVQLHGSLPKVQCQLISRCVRAVDTPATTPPASVQRTCVTLVMLVNSRDGITLHTRAAEAQLRDVIRENVQPYTIHVDRQASL